MKQNKYVRRCGPYKVVSISQDHAGVRLVVYPAFPQYNLTPKEQSKDGGAEDWAKEPRWSIHRYKGEGGGPGLFSCMALADEFEKFLNQQYTETETTNWKTTCDEALSDYNKKQQKLFERAMKKQENNND